MCDKEFTDIPAYSSVISGYIAFFSGSYNTIDTCFVAPVTSVHTYFGTWPR